MTSPARRRLFRPALPPALAALAVLAALAGCAEVTRFERSDGGTIYHVRCRDSLAWLENCRDAARRVCPDGYAPADVSLRLGTDQERHAVPHPHESFFVCTGPTPPPAPGW